MQFRQDSDKLTVMLEGHVDTNNADSLEDQIVAKLAEGGAERLEFDASRLTYISSAGLRVIMRLLPKVTQVSVVNTPPDIYDVFDMTGVSQILHVRKELREVSIDGLEQIGAGANGRVYRLDEERIIKVYNPLTNTPEKILRERDVSRKAFVRGIPSAISFELVRVGGRYGIIYEMIDAHTLGETINLHPDKLEEYAKRMAQMLKQLHATEFATGDLPDARLSLHMWGDVAEQSGLYSAETIAKVRHAIDVIPQGNTFVHGDFHPGNIMVTDKDEMLLIDMGDASMGDPIVDLCGSCQIMFVMQRNPQAIKHYTSLDLEDMQRVWDIFIRTYLGTDDEAQIGAAVRRMQFYGFIRTLAGLSFTPEIPDESRPIMAKRVNEVFLEEYDKLIES